MRNFTFSVFLFVLSTNFAFAQKDDADAATPGPEKCPQLQASTVFISDKGKKGSAPKLTDSHKVAESQGWSFDEMSLYVEDGDLQGFYVTYTRAHPCNKQS
jgi:hypothetical protein